MVALTSKERFNYCDPHMLKLIKVLMIADSSSYSFMDDSKGKLNRFRKEFEMNSVYMIAEWKQFHQK